MPKILVSRKISDLAEEKLKKEFDVTLNLEDEPIPEDSWWCCRLVSVNESGQIAPDPRAR